MAEAATSGPSDVLAVDIGATFTKYCAVASDGTLRGAITRLDTPYPCRPVTLVDTVARIINHSGFARAAVGFPGDMLDGRVLEPGNLSRAGGITTPIDPLIDAQWVNFDLQTTLQARCQAEVRVVNDATLAAHGYARGEGRELIFTLGTGLGISLVVDGRWQKIRDIGSLAFHDVGTYDEVFGEPSRARDQALWRRNLAVALSEFVLEFSPDLVHVGGGNARHVHRDDLAHIGAPVEFNDNEGTLRGAARLFEAS